MTLNKAPKNIVIGAAGTKNGNRGSDLHNPWVPCCAKGRVRFSSTVWPNSPTDSEVAFFY